MQHVRYQRQRCFTGVLQGCHRNFTEVSKGCHWGDTRELKGCGRVVTGLLQVCHKGVLQGCHSAVVVQGQNLLLQVCYRVLKGVLLVWANTGCLRGVRGVSEGCKMGVKEMLHQGYRGVTQVLLCVIGMLQECHRSVTVVLQGVFHEFYYGVTLVLQGYHNARV